MTILLQVLLFTSMISRKVFENHDFCHTMYSTLTHTHLLKDVNTGMKTTLRLHFFNPPLPL